MHFRNKASWLWSMTHRFSIYNLLKFNNCKTYSHSLIIRYKCYTILLSKSSFFIIGKIKHECIYFYTKGALAWFLIVSNRNHLCTFGEPTSHSVTKGGGEKSIPSFIFHRGKQGTIFHQLCTQWSGKSAWKWEEGGDVFIRPTNQQTVKTANKSTFLSKRGYMWQA